MGRRALRQIESGLDLTRHLRALEQLPRPWDSIAVFGRHAPLEIEVGSGKGLFLGAAASASPEHNFLGIEIARKYARFAAARLARRQLANACMVQGDAARVLQEVVPDNVLAAVHVYFPDPWWKARHKKRRVMNVPFSKQIERTLMLGGKLHFWTDVEEYFQSTLDLLRDTTLLQGPFEVTEQAAEHDLDYRTHFERRTRLHGEAVYRAEFKKAEVTSP